MARPSELKIKVVVLNIKLIIALVFFMVESCVADTLKYGVESVEGVSVVNCFGENLRFSKSVKIPAGAVLEIRECSLILDKGFKPPLFIVDGGLILEKNTLTVDWDAKAFDQSEPPKSFIISSGPLVGDDESEGVYLSLRDNVFINLNNYPVGLLYVGAKNEAIKQRKFIRRDLHEFVLENNEISGFHGALYLLDAKWSYVSTNRLYKNSFGNIVVSGRDVLVNENIVYKPGRSGPGDGINLLPSNSAKIVGNFVSHGSCYGIVAQGDHMGDVHISHNTVNDGITSAIAVNPLYDEQFISGRYDISNNEMENNVGAGVYARNYESLYLMDNKDRFNGQQVKY